MENSVTLVIPLTITVSLGEPQLNQRQPDKFNEVKDQFQKQLTNQLDQILDSQNACFDN